MPGEADKITTAGQSDLSWAHPLATNPQLDQQQIAITFGFDLSCFLQVQPSSLGTRKKSRVVAIRAATTHERQPEY